MLNRQAWRAPCRSGSQMRAHRRGQMTPSGLLSPASWKPGWGDTGREPGRPADNADATRCGWGRGRVSPLLGDAALTHGVHLDSAVKPRPAGSELKPAPTPGMTARSGMRDDGLSGLRKAFFFLITRGNPAQIGNSNVINRINGPTGGSGCPAPQGTHRWGRREGGREWGALWGPRLCE